MNTLNIKLYQILHNDLKLSEPKAQEFIEAMASAIDDRKNELATKQDLSEAKADIIKWVAAIIIGQTALIITLIKVLG